MTDNSHLLVYRASAGSGKTFTLAVEYIKQLILDPYAYRHILAVTFTNKATAEMKERILSQLYGIAHQDPKSKCYFNKIKESTGLPDQEITEAAGKALNNIIHDYSRFRIETIDSFFQSVMRNLARELELERNLNIELDTTEAINDTVDVMIEKMTEDSPALRWILNYIEHRINDNKRWNMSGEIKKFAKNLFNEEYLEKGNELQETLQDTDFIKKIQDALRNKKTETQEVMKGFYEHFLEVLHEQNLEPTDLKSGMRGVASYFNKLNNGSFKEDNRNKTMESCLESAENWSSKTSAKRDVIVALAEQQLIPLLSAAEEMRPRANRLVNSCDLTLRHLYNLPLLVYIDKELREQNKMHNRFMLSDTTALLHKLIGKEDASFIYEKIGSSINIVMIDEFQDTSRLQWSNFHQLLEECLSQYNGSLIVGDVKQSIYRWRNGDWSILAGLGKDKDSFNVQTVPLTKNWRSGEYIIRFNNMFFQKLRELLAQGDPDNKIDGFKEIENIYSDVAQEYEANNQGFVRLSLLPEKLPSTNCEQEQLLQLAQQIKELIDGGQKQNEIAILVRKKKWISMIADYFDKNTEYRIVSDEAFQLDASLSVCMLIDCLRILANHDDLIASARLAVAYQQHILKNDTDTNTILLQGAINYLPEAFAKHLEQWSLMPLYELLERLFLLFDMKLMEKQDAYVSDFFDSVTEYLSKKSSEMNAFLKYWDETLHKKAIPSGEPEGIRIMSIHKSKGLEFPTVLLPFCDWNIENETNDHLVWCQDPKAEGSESIFGKLPLTPINYSSSMKESVYKDSYLQEQHNLWVDNMNLLYVAFTRPCKNLFIWGVKGHKDTVSKWLEDTVYKLQEDKLTTTSMPMQTEEDSDIEVFEYGKLSTANPEHAELIQNVDKTNKTAVVNRLMTKSTPLVVTLDSLNNPSNIEFRQSNRSAAFIKGEEEDEEVNYADRGSLLHYLFSNIKKAQDLPRALEQLRFEGLFRSAEEEEQVQRLAEEILNMPQIKPWFEDGWEVYNERSIIYTTEDGTVKPERPDRVMRQGDQVIVVDFKFGHKKPKHQEQVSSYMTLLKQMGYEHVNGYLLYGYSRELIEVAQ